MMNRRMPLVALALALAAVLGGCVAIPDSGAVKTGGKIDTETQVQGVYQPTGPQLNSTPNDIVKDFISAALDPQNDYAIARSFITGAQHQKWNPNFSVTLQSGAGYVDKSSTSTHVIYDRTAVASIDATGAYTELPSGQLPSGVHFDLVKVKVNGSEQWRISNLPAGVIVSESTFDAVYTAYPLYFFAPGYKYLVPDVRWFATTDNVATRIANALLAGASPALASPVLVTAFPPGTTLDSGGVEVDSAIATVELSADAKQSTTAADRSRMQQQMSATLTSVPTVRSVALTIAGVPLGTAATRDPASVQPSVNAATLVQQSDALGFTTGTRLSEVPGISDKTKTLGLTGASFLDDSSVLAARGPMGIYLVKSDAAAAPAVIPKSSTSVDPSIDPTGFAWYVKKDKLSTLSASLAGGAPVVIDTTSLGGNARVVSLDVSRDGARLLLYVVSDGVPRLVVVGIIRSENNVPLKLAPNPVSLPVSTSMPIDATWENDRAVAVISGVGASAAITEFDLSGPSTSLGNVAQATQIVGGNGGQSGLRVLDAAGVVHSTAGAGTGWQAAGFSADFLVTQQPG